MGSREIDTILRRAQHQLADMLALTINRYMVDTILGCDPESFKKSLVSIFIAYQDKDGYHEIYPPKYGLGTKTAKSGNNNELY